VFARQGETNLPQAQRTFAYQFDRALAILASYREKSATALRKTGPIIETE